jgi:hypothetical protein
MPDGFTAAGAAPQATDFAPLTMDRYITGLFTQRSPLRDADVPYLYEKFYSASRYDSFIDGANIEMSARLTTIRRPGSSIYNSQVFDPVNRFYPFRITLDNQTVIKVMVDCANTVFDGTGPATKAVVWNKSAKAQGAKTFFQSVGNTLYFTNGIDRMKWTLSTVSYQPSTDYTPGQFIIDPNNNIQVAEGGFSVGILGVSSKNNVTTLLLDPNDPNLPGNLRSLVGVNITFAGLDVATYLNGQTLPIVAVPTASSISVAFATADFSLDPEIGTASSGNGITGAVAPTWGTAIGEITQDGGQQWICKGSSVQNWGIDAPTVPPSRVQSPLPNIFPAWTANQYFSTCFLITDPNGNIELVTTFGKTGSAIPAFNPATGGTTIDNTVTWTNQGSAAYPGAGVPVALGAFLEANDALGNPYYFKAIVAGNTGASAPTFAAGLGTTTQDGGVLWENVGIGQVWGDITSSVISGNFGLIPVQGGGFVAIGVGQGAAPGSSIALPAGFTASQMVAWNTPGNANVAQSSGPFQATSAGGVLNASFQNRSSGFGFNATSNWAAAAWAGTAAGAITVTTVGGLTFVSFTTAQGDPLCICAGELAHGASVAIPSGGFSASEFQYIVGPAATNATGNGLNVVQQCALNGTLQLSLIYNDNAGHTWNGQANVFGVFWIPGGGVTQQSVTSGTAILIPTNATNTLALIQAQAHDTTSFGLPSGFGSSTVVATAAVVTGTLNGSHVAHGWNVTVTGQTIACQYIDNTGVYTEGDAAVFALAAILSTTTVSPTQSVIDTNGFQETIVRTGISGTAAPAWATAQGALTNDGSAVWENAGNYSAAATAAVQYGFSFKNSTTDTVSTMSPVSAASVVAAGNFNVVSGPGSPDTQTDTIVIFRTLQGGGIFLEDDEIPAPPPGQNWTYDDFTPDTSLDTFIEAPINHANDRPPLGFTAIAFHLNRIFGAVNSVLEWCTGPDVTIGNGLEAFAPANVEKLPDAIARLVPVTLDNGGLLCWTASDVMVEMGTGTATNPFFNTTYAKGTSLLNYDALDTVGATIHAFTGSGKQISFDPSAGYTETGFPIGDQFKKVTTAGFNQALYDPRTAFVSWHEQDSGDTALFVADGSVGWFRYSPVSAPESGFIWSPFAVIQGGTSAVQNVETTPGTFNLLMGPQVSGPILMRDASVNSDNGAPFANTFGTIGSMQLCQPYEVVEVAGIVLDSMRVGTAPSVGILFGEIKSTTEVPFDMLEKTGVDPPLLPESVTLFNDRFSTLQNGVCPQCRHMQLRLQWSVEDEPSELLTHTVYGRKHNERVSQP